MLNRQRIRLGLILFSVLLAGCQATTGYYKGAKAEPETVRLLQEATKAEQHWQDLYVRVDYRVQQQGDRFAIEGFFTFSDYPQLNQAQVADFKLKLFLLNKEHLVVDYMDLYRTAGPSLTEKMAFHQPLPISAEITALSVGYEGVFIGDFGSRETASKLPKRNF